MTKLEDMHSDIERDIECLNTQRENITCDMAQVVALDAKLERVRQIMEEERAIY